MAKEKRDSYLLRDRTVVPMLAARLEKSYPLEYYDSDNPNPIELPVYKLVLACPTVGHGIKKSDLMNPDAAPNTATPSVEVYVALMTSRDGLKTVFWDGDGSQGAQMFVSMKGGRPVLRGSLFKRLALDCGIDLTQEGEAKAPKGKSLNQVYVKCGYQPGKGTQWSPKNTYRGHSTDKDFFAGEMAGRMGALSGAMTEEPESASLSDKKGVTGIPADATGDDDPTSRMMFGDDEDNAAAPQAEKKSKAKPKDKKPAKKPAKGSSRTA